MSNNQPYVSSSLEPVPNLPYDLANFVQMIRLYLRDYPELNRLISGEESSDRMIVWAVLDAIEDFNVTPPPITLGFRDIPKSILKYQVVCNLMESLMFLGTRNALSYSDGGISVNLDKTGLLMQQREMMRAAYEQKKKEFKISRNIEQCYGSVQTEYWFLSGFYGAW